MKFIFGAGGTGGHVLPALALADELQARGHSALFIGNQGGIEEQLCKTEAYPFVPIRVQKLYRSLKPENLLFPYYLSSSVFKALGVIRCEQPSAVICTGGFVSGPVALAARILKVPLFFHESNSYPGLVTRFLKRSLSRIYISFEGSRRFLGTDNLKNYGIPLKKRQTTEFDLAKVGLQNGVFTVLISGGSQGSLAINQAVAKVLPRLQEKGWQLLWQTGSRTYQQFAHFRETAGVHLFTFSPELPAMMAKADLAVTRAGAMTIAELEETRTPAVLIPLPTAAENHQYYNALEQQKKGVALLLPQAELSSDSLMKAIETIKQRHEEYKDKLLSCPPNQAAQEIISDLLDFLAHQPGVYRIAGQGEGL